jgi:hypothetical protein
MPSEDDIPNEELVYNPVRSLFSMTRHRLLTPKPKGGQGGEMPDSLRGEKANPVIEHRIRSPSDNDSMDELQ